MRWQVNNATPFPAFAAFERDHEARTLWCIWVKATFAVGEGGRVRFDPDQASLFEVPLEMESERGAVMLADAEVTLPRALTDIVISARAAPPPGWSGAEPFEVTAQVGDWDKTLAVWPRAEWDEGDKAMAMPGDVGVVTLAYVNGYGGEGVEDNPSGMGWLEEDVEVEGNALPRVLYPGEEMRRPKDQPRAAGLNALPRHWPQRAQYAGTYDTAWMKRRAPLLPQDFSPKFWQSVAEDQQIAPPEGGETVTLTNMRPGHDGPFTFDLPRLEIGAEVDFDGTPTAVEMTPQILHIVPDDGRFTLTFCGTLPIRTASNDVKVGETRLWVAKHEGFVVRSKDIAVWSGTRSEDATETREES